MKTREHGNKKSFGKGQRTISDEIKIIKSLLPRLRYDEQTGFNYWLNGRHKGKKAGCVTPRGYTTLTNNTNSKVREHRLNWYRKHGSLPLIIDHIRQDKNQFGAFSNHPDNLRVSTPNLNKYNATPYKTNKLGMKGVCFYKGKYIGKIQRGGKNVYYYSHENKWHVWMELQKAAKVIMGEFYKPEKIVAGIMVIK